MTNTTGNNSMHWGYRLFKYFVFIALTINAFAFLENALEAKTFIFAKGVSAIEVMQTFAESVDSFTWIILLLLFELETNVLDDRLIKGRVKFFLHGLRSVCIVALLYAFAGYTEQMLSTYEFVVAPNQSFCDLVPLNYSLMTSLAEYEPLTLDNCVTVTGTVMHLNNFDIASDVSVVKLVQAASWIDVLNAGAWLLVVALLEVDVRLQLKGGLTVAASHITRILKLIVYLTLGLCSLYWLLTGGWLGFWDSVLWIIAFIFIELNVVQWQQETAVSAKDSSQDSPEDVASDSVDEVVEGRTENRNK